MGQGFGVLYLLGAVQGVFLAAVLAGRRHGSTPNRLLAAAMLVFSLDLAMAVYHASGTAARMPAFIGLDLPVAALYGPLLYLYVRTLTDPERGLGRRDLLHAVPFALLVVYFAPFFLRSGEERLAVLADPSLDVRIEALGIITPLKLAHALAYIVALVALLRRHRRRLADEFSSTDRVTLDWLRNLVAGIVVLAGVTFATYAFVTAPRGPTVGLDPLTYADDLTLLALTVFVYAIGYLGLRQPEIFGSRVRPPATGEPRSVERPRYARSGMGADTSARIEDTLVALMETERPYRRGDLTLHDLAAQVSVSPHNVTEVINTRLGQSFHDFVNGYRVREVQERLAGPDAERLTLLAIAMEAGFNSKSAFNAAFRRHAGVTPSAYRESVGSGGATEGSLRTAAGSE
jgi:AraC-like DNA-binding protein